MASWLLVLGIPSAPPDSTEMRAKIRLLAYKFNHNTNISNRHYPSQLLSEKVAPHSCSDNGSTEYFSTDLNAMVMGFAIAAGIDGNATFGTFAFTTVEAP